METTGWTTESSRAARLINLKQDSCYMPERLLYRYLLATGPYNFKIFL